MRLPVADLSSKAKDIVEMCDDYIDTLQLTQGHLPSAIHITKQQAKTIQSSLNTVNNKQNQGLMIKTDPIEVSECEYRNVPIKIV